MVKLVSRSTNMPFSFLRWTQGRRCSALGVLVNFPPDQELHRAVRQSWTRFSPRLSAVDCLFGIESTRCQRSKSL